MHAADHERTLVLHNVPRRACRKKPAQDSRQSILQDGLAQVVVHALGHEGPTVAVQSVRCKGDHRSRVPLPERSTCRKLGRLEAIN